MRQNSSITATMPVLWVAALATAFVYWLPAWWAPDKTGFGDWQQFLHQWEAARIAIVRYGEWPKWNPYHCGGVMLWGDPQAQAYSPLFPLAFVIGSNLALKLSMTLHMAVGLVGMFLFAREHVAMSASAAALSSFFWCTSGFFAWHLSGGHPAFFPFFFTPWVLIFWRQAQVDRRGIAKLALVLSITLFEGGVYPFPFFALLLLFDGAHTLMTSNYRFDVIKAAAGVVVLTTMISAFRLVPVASTMSQYPRPTAGSDKISASEVLQMLTAYTHSRRWNHEYVWDEYGTLIGWFGLTLAVLGLLVAVAQRRWWIVAGTLLFGSIMVGDHGPLWPWRLLHHVPVFDSLRVPSRFAVLLTFFIALGVGLIADKLRRASINFFGSTTLLKLLPLVLLGVFVTETYAGNFKVLNRFRYPPLEVEAESPTFYLTDSSEYRDYASFPARGVGNARCYSGMNYPPARRLWVGKLPQAKIENGKVRSSGQTTNTAFAEVDADSKTEVTFNRTYAPGWQARIVDLDQPAAPGAPPHFETSALQADRWGRAMAVVPKGSHRIELRYEPPLFWESLGVSGLGIVAALLVLFLRRR